MHFTLPSAKILAVHLPFNRSHPSVHGIMRTLGSASHLQSDTHPKIPKLIYFHQQLTRIKCKPFQCTGIKFLTHIMKNKTRKVNESCLEQSPFALTRSFANTKFTMIFLNSRMNIYQVTAKKPKKDGCVM